MTKEQIIQNIKARISTIESYRPDEYALNEGNLFELKDLLLMIEKDELSIPSNLDEAAEEFEKHAMEDYDEICVNEDGSESPVLNCDLKDAFKAGAKWRDAQIPKLPNSIDEAAEKYAIQGHENHTNVNYINTYIEGKRIGFKAGAEWMAEQGETVAGTFHHSRGYPSVIELKTYLRDYEGEDVIVQIRKKED